jgi:queuosine precursor transporter
MNQTALTAPSLSRSTMVISIYIGFVVLLNTLFVYLPMSSFYGHEFTYADFAVGGIYVVRDLAQRAIGHKVIFAMIIAAVLCYVLADKQIALASFSAFAIGETVDWAIYTYTKKPLSQRILLSASVSSPIDSAVFLAMLGRLAPFEFILMTVIKIAGAIFVWAFNKGSARKSLAV